MLKIDMLDKIVTKMLHGVRQHKTMMAITIQKARFKNCGKYLRGKSLKLRKCVGTILHTATWRSCVEARLHPFAHTYFDVLGKRR